jgi:predicted ATPase
MVVHGWALADSGRVKEGVEEIRRGVADYASTGAEMWSPYFLGLLAEALGRAGQAEAGLDLLSEALERSDRMGGRWVEAELYRLRGELLSAVAEPREGEADAAFRRSLAIAGEQGATTWELRTAMSLSARWRDKGELQQPYDLLAPILERFTAGADTHDLRWAKSLVQNS